MKKELIALLLAFFGILSGAAYADVGVVVGKPLEVFADPSDIVVALDTNTAIVGQSCASKYFHFQRTNMNFKELTAMAISALVSGNGMRLFVISCSGDRNIVSHGSIRVP